MPDVAAHAEQARARVVWGADPGECLAAHRGNVPHMAQGLHIVDDGRALVQAEHGRKIRRLDSRVRAFALQRLDHARLLAANVGAGAAVDVDLARIAGTENVRPDQVLCARLGDGLFENPRPFRKLAADVDIRLHHLVGPAGDHDPLDQLVRILVDDVPVLEGPRLGLVGVDDEVDRLAALAINE